MHDIAGWSPLQLVLVSAFRESAHSRDGTPVPAYRLVVYRLVGVADERPVRPPLLQLPLYVSAIPGPGRLLERIASWREMR